MVTINNYDEFAAYLGKNLGVSDYVELSQERINLFADATLDHQWIHVDTERAAVESPYKTTIAHGYLTLSTSSSTATRRNRSACSFTIRRRTATGRQI